MITKDNVLQVLEGYDLDNITIAMIGSHSALDKAYGASKLGFKNVVVCLKGREAVYDKYYKKRVRGPEYEVGCVDETIVINDWKDLASDNVLKKLRDKNSIMIPDRSLEVYLKYKIINEELLIPIFGNRLLLQAEERSGDYVIEKNQDYLFDVGGILTPEKFDSVEKIDRPVVIKAPKGFGKRPFERRFVMVKIPEEDRDKPDAYVSAYKKKLEIYLSDRIREYEKEMGLKPSVKEIENFGENFKSAIKEEYISGKVVNLNFFYSQIWKDLELIGTDTRDQFPSDDELNKGEEETHSALSLRESLLKPVFLDLGEKFVAVTKKEFPPNGIIGPFALQCLGDKKENLRVIDASLRIPGSPDAAATPYPWYLYDKPMNFGWRIALEIKDAIKQNRLGELVS